MLHTVSVDDVYKACKHSDSIGSPFWLDELIDLAIAYLQTDLEPEEWQEMCDKIQKGDY